MDLYSHILIISSVVGAVETILLFIAFLFKPARIYIKNTFNKFIKEPDEQNRNKINQILKQQENNEEQLKTIKALVREQKRSADQVDLAILRHLILNFISKVMKKGSMTLNESHELGAMVDSYRSLGGNGTVQAAYEKCLSYIGGNADD